MCAVATDFDAAVVVCERHAAVRRPLGAERTHQGVNLEIGVGFENADALAEVHEGNVVQPGRESTHAAADAHVLSGEAAALQVDALSDLQFVLVVDGFEGHGATQVVLKIRKENFKQHLKKNQVTLDACF